MRRMRVLSVAGLLLAGAASLPGGAAADDAYAAALKDIEQTFGRVPSFLGNYPKAGLPGAWAELKGVLLSDDTALPRKTKALIGLAVVAQIPCAPCVWMDTNEAKRAGATDEEINEAIAIAGIERHWSAVLDGMQIDLEAFKAEFAGSGEGEGVE